MQNPSLDASVRKTATRAGELADVAFGICAHTADLCIFDSKFGPSSLFILVCSSKVVVERSTPSPKNLF